MTMRRGQSWLWFSIAVLLCIGAALLLLRTYQPKEKLLEISLLDVGQGDAILLEAPTGQTILIDGGPDNKVLRRLGEELPFWERRIDLMVVSHPHEDHIAGLNPVLERYEVGAVMITGVEANSPTYRHFLDLIQEKHIPLYITDRPENISIGEIVLHILYPLTSFKDKRISNLNNSSIVIKASYKDVDMLLSGDAEEPEEKELLASGEDLSAEILKAGHHGSETSSSEALLEKVKPEIILISCGAGNSYGHPSPRTMKRFERLGIPARRTDLEGTIRIRTDGVRIFQ